MYRKFKAHQLFTGYEFLEEIVLITDTVGKIIELVPEKEAGDNIEILDGLLCPGFINAHCHLELSHMKGLIPKNTGLVDFVFKVVNERHFEEDAILAAIEKAENEMFKNGIVAVGDICNNVLTISQKTKNHLRYHNFIEASGFSPAVAQTRFKRAYDFYNAYSKVLPANSIVPHAPYSVSPQLFQMIDAFSNNHLLTIHNQEIEAENDLFEKGTGDFLRMYEKMGIDISFFKPSQKSSLQTWLPNFTKAQTVILVHNVATREKDLEFIKQYSNINTYFCLCTNANWYISQQLPDVNLLIKHSEEIVLGTDSLASNDQLCILEEMKTLHRYFSNLSLTNLLQWATSNASKALQMDDQLGSFEKSKQPGLVLIEGLHEFRLTENSKARRIL